MTDWTDEEIAEERITNLLRDVEILTRRAEAAEAEAKRLREVLEAGLDLTQSWSDVRTHDWRNEARAALRGER